jgi:hypothetical protein
LTSMPLALLILKYFFFSASQYMPGRGWPFMTGDYGDVGRCD